MSDLTHWLQPVSAHPAGHPSILPASAACGVLAGPVVERPGRQHHLEWSDYSIVTDWPHGTGVRTYSLSCLVRLSHPPTLLHTTPVWSGGLSVKHRRVIATWLQWPNTYQYHKVATQPPLTAAPLKVKYQNSISAPEQKLKGKLQFCSKRFIMGSGGFVSHIRKILLCETRIETWNMLNWNKQSDRENSILYSVLCTYYWFTDTFICQNVYQTFRSQIFFFSFDIFSKMLNLCPACM